MRKRFLRASMFILSVFLVLGICTESIVQAQGVGLEEILIGFKKFPGNSEKALVEKAGGKIKYTYHLIPVIAASVPSSAIKGLRHNPNVAYVEDDGDIFLDSELTDSWGVDRIDAELAWIYPVTGNKGAGIHVAVIDTGIDKDHPDLIANIAGGMNFVAGKGKDKTADPEAWDDDHGHGSHCAGIVAADDNGFGVVGVAPDAWLYGVKILDNRGRGKESDFIAGLQWAVDGPDGNHGTPDDAEIVSISLRMSGESVGDACHAACAAGLLLVKSAGNNWGGGVTSPGDHPSVIAVSAIDQYDNIAEFSSVGPSVELAAPGVDIYSTYKNGGYTYMDGTSMACPHVSGTAALVWATGYYISGSAVRFQLNRTAEWLDNEFNLSPEQQGNGMVDAEKAVTPPDPAVNFELSQNKSDYNINETALLTAVVSDQNGNPTSGLLPSAFVTNLYEIEDPDQTPIPRSVTFVETQTVGTYTGELTFSDLATGGYLEIKYRAEVEVTDIRELSGTDDVTFWVVDQTGSLSVLIEPDKSPPECYALGDTINVRVTVMDANSNIIPGADVHVELNVASGRYYLRDEITNQAGVADFKFKTKSPDGTGDYLIRVWASKLGYPSTYDEMVVCVH
jgi:hypothetical protein